MDLLPASEALAFLAKSAPAPWAKRMLLWMVCDEELDAFFNEGRSVSTNLAGWYLVDDDGQSPEPAEREKYINKHFAPDLAQQLLKARDTDEVEELICEWGLDDEPRQVSAGCLYHAQHIDWQNGVVEAQVFLAPRSGWPDLFWEDDELLAGHLRHGTVSIVLKGLSFDRESIELLQPNVPLVPVIKTQSVERSRKGRPPIWDWHGATAHLLGIAQTPDGLPTGAGSQAAIEREVATWFTTTTGNSPAPSQIRKYVSGIAQKLKSPKTR